MTKVSLQCNGVPDIDWAHLDSWWAVYFWLKKWEINWDRSVLQFYNTHVVAQGECMAVQHIQYSAKDPENCGLGLDDLPRGGGDPSKTLAKPIAGPPPPHHHNPPLPVSWGHLLSLCCIVSPLVEIEQTHLSRTSFLPSKLSDQWPVISHYCKLIVSSSLPIVQHL